MRSVNVRMLPWPESEGRRQQLRLLGVPVLLLVSRDQVPPDGLTPLEDWVRYPSSDPIEMTSRLQNLRRRALHTVESPLVEHGTIRVGADWVPLSPVGERLAVPLAQNFGELVGCDALLEQGWPTSGTSPRNLHVAVGRLRRHVGSLGLDIHTVVAKGYLMKWATLA